MTSPQRVTSDIAGEALRAAAHRRAVPVLIASQALGGSASPAASPSAACWRRSCRVRRRSPAASPRPRQCSALRWSRSRSRPGRQVGPATFARRRLPARPARCRPRPGLGHRRLCPPPAARSPALRRGHGRGTAGALRRHRRRSVGVRCRSWCGQRRSGWSSARTSPVWAEKSAARWVSRRWPDRTCCPPRPSPHRRWSFSSPCAPHPLRAGPAFSTASDAPSRPLGVRGALAVVAARPRALLSRARAQLMLSSSASW